MTKSAIRRRREEIIGDDPIVHIMHTLEAVTEAIREIPIPDTPGTKKLRDELARLDAIKARHPKGKK